MTEAGVAVHLTSDEAVVLFELVHRWEHSDSVAGPLEPGEQVALWALSAALETQLVEPFRANYAEFVHAARERLAAQ